MMALSPTIVTAWVMGMQNANCIPDRDKAIGLAKTMGIVADLLALPSDTFNELMALAGFSKNDAQLIYDDWARYLGVR